MVSDWERNVAKRKEPNTIKKTSKGWKTIPCTACSGSARYCGRKCGGCDGTGKMKVSPAYYKGMTEYLQKKG